MTPLKRIAVIGAGPSGLTAVKCLKEEGMTVTCFEKTDSIGGRWCYREKPMQGVASVMKTTTSLYSKEISAFSDFPPPEEFPNYMHHTKMLEYLNLYAEKFDLFSHIRYNNDVVWISPSENHEKTGKWLITVKNLKIKMEFSEEYDGVVVCSGRLAYPFTPTFTTLNQFQGTTLHSYALKSPMEFENMNVVVVGSGNSAVDAAVEISTFAKQVYLSTRKGTWIFPKLGHRGLPHDLSIMKRSLNTIKHISNKAVNGFIEKYLEKRLNHVACKLKPKNRALDELPTINEDLSDKILTGRVCIKGIIARFTNNGVLFENEENVTEADAIIFATGYEVNLPFLDEKIYKSEKGYLNLYKHIFPVGSKHPTLAIVGFLETNGPMLPISESQSRWAARIFNKKLKLPAKETMEAHMEIKLNGKELLSTKLEEDYIAYMDDLAVQYGAKPCMSTLLFKDPNLYWYCITGPFLPYQYRIVGPHSWNGSRNAIFEYEKRVSMSLETRPVQNKNKGMYEKF